MKYLSSLFLFIFLQKVSSQTFLFDSTITKKVDTITVQLDTVNIITSQEKFITPTHILSIKEIEMFPKMAESDILRTLQIFPSISQSNEFSSSPVIRGGAPLQSLFLLDGVPIFNSFHLGGIVSSINPDIAQNISLYTSNYPPMFGGVVSGLCNIETQNENPVFESNTSISILSAKTTMNIPLGNGNLQVAGRRMYLDVIAVFMSDHPPLYYFYDIYSKYQLTIDEKNNFSIFMYHSQDTYDIFGKDEEDKFTYPQDYSIPHWGNFVSKIEFFHNTQKNVNISFSGYYTTYYVDANTTRFLKEEPTTDINSIIANNNITQAGIKGNFNYNIQNHNINAGIEYSHPLISTNWKIHSSLLEGTINSPTQVFFDFAPPEYSSSQKENIMSGFFIDKYSFSPSLTFNLGSRIDYFFTTSNIMYSPFIRTEYSLENEMDFYVSYGKYFQLFTYFTQQQKSSLFSTGFSVPFLSTKTFPTAHHFLFGIHKKNIIRNTNVSVELYSIMRKNIPLIVLIDETHNTSNENTTGVDFSTQYHDDKIDGMISYTLSFSTANIGNYFYWGDYDQRHSMKIFGSFKLNEHWNISLFWQLQTGLPFSTPTKIAWVGNEKRDIITEPFTSSFSAHPLYEKLNSRRSPIYHRLDCTLTYNFSIGNTQCSAFLSILNLYNNKNKYFIGLNTSYIPPQTTELTGIPILPLIGGNIAF